MRVVLFTDADVFAGTERHMLDLAQGLRNEGINVSIACPQPAILADQAKDRGFPVLTIQKGGLIDWPAIRILRRLLKWGRIDIIHAHNGRTALSAAMAVRLAGRGRCIYTQHFLEPGHLQSTSPQARLARQAHHWVNQNTHHVIAISEAVRDAMLERSDVPGEKITVIPNGLSVPDKAGLRTPEQTRKEFGLETETPLVVCVARLEQEKDIASLIAAMRGVVDGLPTAVCLMAGDGSQKEQLQRQIRAHDLEQSVRLLGFVPDALSIIHATDVFVLPSLAEPFGLVLLEAMALGKPVIATRVGGPLEIVVEGETGFLVPPSAPPALTQAILKLLADPAAAHVLGNQGRKRFEEKYTVERMAGATASVYKQVLEYGK